MIYYHKCPKCLWYVQHRLKYCSLVPIVQLQLGFLHRYTREIPEPAPFLSRHGAQNWASLGFSCDQNNRDLSGAYATCDLNVKIFTRKTLHGTPRLWTHLLCICFCVCGQQKPEHPNVSPLADNALTLGGIVWDLPCISVVSYHLSKASVIVTSWMS